MERGIDKIRNSVRGVMHEVAKALNKATKGRLSPNSITLVGLFAHLPIAWLIAQNYYLWGALFLVIFGLFDTLDGELARLQKRASNKGMLLDASTDRIKEVILYAGVAFSFIASGVPYFAVWAVIACGASLSVSYVKAKGETALTKGNLTANEINRLFQDGFLRYEVRMFLLVVGLVINRLPLAIVVIAILSSITAVQRLVLISNKLDRHV